MIVSRTGIACIADVTEQGSFLHFVPFMKIVSPSLKVRVVIEIFLVNADLVDRDPAALAIKEFHDGSVSGRDHRRSAGRHYIYGVVDSSLRPRLRKCVDKLLR